MHCHILCGHDKLLAVARHLCDGRRSPVLLAGSLTSLALVVGAALDWHRTLQYVGVAGLLLSVLNRTTTYESPQVSYRDT